LRARKYVISYASVKRYVVKKRRLLNQAREGYLPIAQPHPSRADGFRKIQVS
jgi:hypothetical protein